MRKLKRHLHHASVKVVKDGEAAAIRYLHNELGQRVFKSEVQPEQTLPSEETLGPGFVNWLRKTFAWLFIPGKAGKALLGQAYVYGDGEIPLWALLGEYDNGTAAGRGRTEFIWLPTEDGAAIPVGLYRAGKLYAIHSDHLGTPRLVTDQENKPVWQWPYSAFGNNKPSGILATTTMENGQTSIKGTRAQLEVSLRFPGQTEDAESGLYDNINRSYWARQGRYTQFDPIGLAGGLNGYAYVGASPLMYTDPLGLRANRPQWWNDLWKPTTDTKHCATAECAAGMSPLKPPKKMSPEACFATCFAAKTGVGLAAGGLTGRLAMSIGPRVGAAVNNLLNSETAILGSELMAVEFCHKQCDFKDREICETDQISNIVAP